MKTRQTTRIRTIRQGARALLYGLTCGVALATAGSALANPPDDAEFLFIQALEERDNGDLQHAIDRFHSILQQHPHLQRARLELAVAYLQALNFAEARSQAEQVLQDPNTPEGVRLRVQAFIERLNEAGQRHRSSPYLSLGAIFDSNVNAGPDQDTFGLPGGGTIGLVPSALSRSDNGLEFSAGISHRYLAPNTVHLFGRDAALLWFNRASGYLLRYGNESDRDLDVISLSSGPMLVAARKWRLGANLLFDHARLDRNNYLRSVAINPSAAFPVGSQGSEFALDLLLQKRDYLRAVDNRRDSHYHHIAGQYRHAVNSQTALQARAELFRENADGSSFSNKGLRANLGASFKLNPETDLHTRIVMQRTHYNTDPLFQLRRKDDQFRLVLALSHNFAPGWGIEGSLAHTHNTSNVDLYDYKRNLLALRMNRRF